MYKLFFPFNRVYCSVAKFRKFGGKSSATAQIFTSSKNSKLHPHILLIQLRSQLHPFLYFQISSSLLYLHHFLYFIVLIHHNSYSIILSSLLYLLFFIEISVCSFFIHLTSLNLTFFATSYPLTENKFDHPVPSMMVAELSEACQTVLQCRSFFTRRCC